MPDAFDFVGESVASDKGTIYDYNASVGEAFGGGLERAADTNPLALLGRQARFFSEDLNSVFGDGGRVDQKTAEDEVRSRGLDIKIPVGGMTRVELDMLQYLKQREVRQNTVAARAPGALGVAAGFAGGLAGSLTDPINIASNFIPIVSQARYAQWLARAGTSTAARAGVRAGAGAMEGAVGAALIEPIVYAGATSQQLDYELTDSFLNVVFGGVMGGGLHPIGGAVYDARVSRALRGLDPGIQSLRDVAANAPEPVQREAFHGAVRALEDDAPVDVRPTFDAWHGSPHAFDRFDLSKIGTGEGAQAYGDGHYLAGARAVGTGYRQRLSTSVIDSFGTKSANDVADEFLGSASGDAEAAAKAIDAKIESRWGDKKPKFSEIGFETLKRYREAAEILRGNAPGFLYDVRVKGRPEDFPIYDGPSGDQARAFADRARAEGKPGIRYLDAGSRDAGDGTYNYVVFRDDDLEVVGRNGETIAKPQSTPRDLAGLLEQSTALRTQEAFNRQFTDGADEATSRAADEAVTKSDEDLKTVAEDVAFLDQQIEGLKSRELWTKADDVALEQGDEAAKAFEKEASIYRAAAVCMMEG